MGNIERRSVGKAVGRADDEVIKGIVIVRTGAIFLFFLLFIVILLGRIKLENDRKAEDFLAGFFNKLGEF